MQISLTEAELKEYLGRQLENHFPDHQTSKYYKGRDIDIALTQSLYRLENCFKHINNSAYSDEMGQTFFYHLHSDQYAHFLYFFMNSLWKESQNQLICDKVLLLNRCLNNMFVSYKCKLPDIFWFAHPVGTILGNAKYSDYFLVSQNVTVNTGIQSELVLGKGLCLMAGAKIIGDEPIGDRVVVGVDAVVYKRAIECDKMVIRDGTGAIVLKDNTKCVQQQYFRTPIK